MAENGYDILTGAKDNAGMQSVDFSLGVSFLDSKRMRTIILKLHE